MNRKLIRGGGYAAEMFMRRHPGTVKHSGRKGMKWGQNIFGKDNVQKEATSKKLSEMSDQELQAVVTRMNLDKQYSKLMSEKADAEKSTTQKFIEWGTETVLNAVQQGAENAIRSYANKTIQGLMNRGDDEDN